jgi:hypothetical protein
VNVKCVSERGGIACPFSYASKRSAITCCEMTCNS